MFEANRHFNRWPRIVVHKDMPPNRISPTEADRILTANLLDCVLIGPDAGQALRKMVYGEA